ncbi:ComEC/Rec2 family competence protein [Zongyangia hominis]|uniref:ComEC/Rec2 family competence protein n=1 Tax=Zongyangia hominis TaxID=2763677 RepID=A0A926EBE4_9FIRM|nr:ComEC/Rec2 family competence protein [Zongyangia hominis]MBC8570787.1 ComEC/Rec2 family competence protein [Zongyangia hominis]
MKRPLAVLGFTYLITQAVACYLSMSVNLMVSLTCFILGAALWLTKLFDAKRTVLLVLFTAALSTGALFLQQRLVYAPAAALDGMQAEITARIVDTPARLSSGSYRYLMETSAVEVEGAPQKLRVEIVSRKMLDVDAYDPLEFRTTFGLADRPSYRAEGIYLRGYVESDVIYTPLEKKPLPYYFLKFRQKMDENITRALPGEEGTLVSAMVTGERMGVSENGLYDLFRRSGVTHFLAISGLHMAILGAMALYFLRKLRFLPYWMPYLMAGVFVLLYLAVLGFSVTATRAGIMLLVYYLARAIGRKSDALNALGLAVLLILAPNPFGAASVSLQLSAFATLAILTVCPKVREWMLGLHPALRKYRVLRWAADGIGLSVGVNLFLLPLLLLYFGMVGLMAPIVSLLLTPLMPVIVIGGFLTALIGMASLAAAAPFAFFAGLAAKLTIGIVRLSAHFDFLSITADAPYVVIWMLFAMAVMGFCYLKRDRLRLRVGVLLCAGLFLVGAISNAVLMRGVTGIQVYGGERSPCLVARMEEGVVVCPIGEPWKGQISLPVTGKIDLLFVQGDYQCYAEVFQEYDIGAVMVDEETPMDKLEPMLPTGCKVYRKGSMRAGLDGASIETLHFSTGTATTFQIGGFSLLMTEGEVDMATLPIQRTAPDVWLCEGKSENPQMIAARYGIVMESAFQRSAMNAMLSQGAKVVTFDGCDRVDVLTRGGWDLMVNERGAIL